MFNIYSKSTLLILIKCKLEKLSTASTLSQPPTFSH